MAKILVVEDEEFLANAYRVKLNKAGYETEIVSNGQEALDVLKHYKPDLILLDLVLPIKDGFVALQEIKANERLRSIPVIVASNLGQDEDIKLAKELGAVDYIIKSQMSIDDLVEKIKKLIKVK